MRQLNLLYEHEQVHNSARQHYIVNRLAETDAKRPTLLRHLREMTKRRTTRVSHGPTQELCTHCSVLLNLCLGIVDTLVPNT
jgi:hypothetical protein